MTRYRIWIACSLFAVLGFVMSELAHSQLIGQENQKATQEKQKAKAIWRFKFLPYHYGEGEKGLNDHALAEELGNDGWELTAAIPKGTDAILFFKRQQ